MKVQITLTDKDIKKLLPSADRLRFKRGFENFAREILKADKIIRDKRLRRAGKKEPEQDNLFN